VSIKVAIIQSNSEIRDILAEWINSSEGFHCSGAIGDGYEFNDGSNYPSTPVSNPVGTEGVGPLHDKKGGNIARLDGGVQFITTNQFNLESKGPPGDATDGKKTRLWWSVYSVTGH
jgi:hypothetical protein